MLKICMLHYNIILLSSKTNNEKKTEEEENCAIKLKKVESDHVNTNNIEGNNCHFHESNKYYFRERHSKK